MDLEYVRKNLHESHQKNRVIISFSEYIELVKKNPRNHLRSATEYILNTLESFGTTPPTDEDHDHLRFKMFELGTEGGQKIIGGEHIQNEIYAGLKSSQASPRSQKLILLHGPNGSAKSSTVDSIAYGMQQYSETDDGAVYRFNWIFPADRELLPKPKGHASSIGFGDQNPAGLKQNITSFAHLEDHKIAARIISEFKESPLFLIPMPYRENLLKEWISENQQIPIEEIEIPFMYKQNGLSKKNFQIFQNLLNGYQGDLFSVLQHIQVERFYYSKRYRIGLSTVEPQMHIDAREKQLTMDQNYANLPTVLHTISFHQAEGELVEANRGMIEFSDFLKRPLESFKYLISTIETNVLNLSSGPVSLDVAYIATTNEKHLDSFKTLPDFSSFKGRMELITVPYLLRTSLEQQIYATDIETIQKIKPISPHSLNILCTWAVMTRLRQPDVETYPEEIRPIILKLGPLEKMRLYEDQSLSPTFSRQEESKLKEYKNKIRNETLHSVAYEGRFGASARELRRILYRIAQSRKYKSMTPIDILAELEVFVADRSVHEFLQFEPRGEYHDVKGFIQTLKKHFLSVYEAEVVESMDLADPSEYTNLLRRYVENVVAEVKNEKILDEATSSYLPASQKIMENIEKIICLEGLKSDFRHSILSRVAAYRLEQPNIELKLAEVFPDLLDKIKSHYNQKYQIKLYTITNTIIAILEKSSHLNYESDLDLAEKTIQNLKSKFGYDENSTLVCIKALIKNKNLVGPPHEKISE